MIKLHEIYKFKTYDTDCKQTHANGLKKFKNIDKAIATTKEKTFTHNLDNEGILTIKYGKNLRSGYRFCNVELISDCEIIPFIVPPALKCSAGAWNKHDDTIFHSEGMSFKIRKNSLYWLPTLDTTCKATRIDTGQKINELMGDENYINRGFSALLSDGLKGEQQKFKIDVSAKTKKALLIACRAYGNCEEIRVSYHGGDVFTIGDYEIDCDITGEAGSIVIENRKFKNVLTKAHTVVILDNIVMFHGKDNSGGIVK